MGSKLTLAIGLIVLGLAAFFLWDQSRVEGPEGDPTATVDARDGRNGSPPRDPFEPGETGGVTDPAAPPPGDESGASEPDVAGQGSRRAPSGPGRIVGRITGPDGVPIAHGEILITRKEEGLGFQLGADGAIVPRPRSEPILLRSDADGRFLREELPAGDYRITVRAPGYTTLTRNVRPGADALRLDLEPAFTISGVLVEATTGDPVAGARVDARPVTSLGGGAIWVGHCGADGHFSIPGLPAGEYTLSFGRMLYQDGNSDWIPLSVGPVAAGATGVRMQARRGLVISGEIRDATGAMLDRPVDVEALGKTARGDTDYSRRRRTRSTKDGRFRITGLPPGSYDLAFEPGTQSEGGADGYAPISAMRKTDVLAGTENLVIVMGQGAVVAGRVVDADGEGVHSSGTLYIHPMGTSSGSQGSVMVMVSSGGEFRSPPLDAATSYRILATSFDGYTQGTLESVRPGDAEIVITLQAAGGISGRVVDEKGKPVPPGVPVSAYSTDVVPGSEKGTMWTGYTTGGGAFILEALGPHDFVIRAGGGRCAYLGHEDADGIRPGAKDVEVVVKLGATITGRLIDRFGDPVKTLYLAASMPIPTPYLPPSTSISADDGSFAIRGLEPGKVTLRTIVGGKTIELGEFEAPARDVVIVLPEE